MLISFYSEILFLLISGNTGKKTNDLCVHWISFKKNSSRPIVLAFSLCSVHLRNDSEICHECEFWP